MTVLEDIVSEVRRLERVINRFDDVSEKLANLMKRYGLDLHHFEEDFDKKIIEYIENLRKEHNGE